MPGPFGLSWAARSPPSTRDVACRHGVEGKESLKRLRAFAALLQAAWIEYERDRASYLAVAMVYYALVSLVPLLLLLLAALGLLLRFAATAAEAQRQTLEGIEARFGPELAATITGLLEALQRESIIATVIGLLGVLFAASVLFRHLRLTFRAIWKFDPPLVSGTVRVVVWKSFLERAVAFVMVVGGGGLLIAALGLIGLAQWLDRTVGELPVLGPSTGWLLSASVSLTLALVTFAFLFKFLPPIPLRWRDVRLAALLSAVSWVAASELLAVYGVFFGGGQSTSGTLGGVLAIMLWMSVVSKILFFGAELSKVVATQGRG